MASADVAKTPKKHQSAVLSGLCSMLRVALLFSLAIFPTVEARATHWLLDSEQLVQPLALQDTRIYDRRSETSAMPREQRRATTSSTDGVVGCSFGTCYGTVWSDKRCHGHGMVLTNGPAGPASFIGPAFNPRPSGLPVCLCNLGYTGPDCQYEQTNFGPFRECSTDGDCDTGMACGRWNIRDGIQNRCMCTASDTPHPECGELGGLFGINCKYGGCGEGFRCLWGDEEAFWGGRDTIKPGVCVCDVNSKAPGCDCHGKVRAVDTGEVVQCTASKKDSAQCVPADPNYKGSFACYRINRVPLPAPGGVCKKGFMWSLAMDTCLPLLKPKPTNTSKTASTQHG